MKEGPVFTSPFSLSEKPGVARRGRSPFDYKSAGGGVYVAEERLKAASYINFL